MPKLKTNLTKTLFGLSIIVVAHSAYSGDRDKDFEAEFAHATRSCVVYFENHSPGKLTLSKTWFSYRDCFADTNPPHEIAAGRRVEWGSESGGLGRAKGSAFYNCNHCSSEVVIKWNIPLVGENGYKFRSGGGHMLEVVRLNDEKNAVVKFIFGAPSSDVTTQSTSVSTEPIALPKKEGRDESPLLQTRSRCANSVSEGDE